jgi:hypothetical protein
VAYRDGEGFREMKESIAEPLAAKVLVSILMSRSDIPDWRSRLRSVRGLSCVSVNGLRGPISKYAIVPSGFRTIFTVVMVTPLPPDKCESCVLPKAIPQPL